MLGSCSGNSLPRYLHEFLRKNEERKRNKLTDRVYNIQKRCIRRLFKMPEYEVPGDTNINDIPAEVLLKLYPLLDNAPTNQNWRAMIAAMPSPPFSNFQVEGFAKAIYSKDSPTKQLLHDLGNKGKTVANLVAYLWELQHETALRLLLRFEPVNITKNPEAKIEVHEGEQIKLECDATGFPFPKFQWFRGRELLIYGTDKVLIIRESRVSNTGAYCCRIENGNRETVKFTHPKTQVKVLPGRLPVQVPLVTSTPAVPAVVIPSNAVTPLITQHPEDQHVQCLQPVRLSCRATGNPLPAYQWMKNGLHLTGEVKPDLLIQQASTTHNGTYYCVASNHYGCINSRAVNLTVVVQDHLLPLEIISHPSSCSVTVGGRHRLECVARGMEPLTYQWYKDNAAIPGAVSSELILNTHDLVQRGKYQCMVENPIGRVLSDVATINFVYDANDAHFTATDKVALLIGNSRYMASTELQGAESDVQNLSVIFEKLGFKVIKLLNLTKDEMKQYIKFFCELLDKGVYGVFYYCGHGFESKRTKQCYMVAQDAVHGWKLDDCICAQYVLQQMQRKDPALCVLILDICRTDLDYKTDEEVIYNSKNPGNRVYLYATSPDFKAYEDSNSQASHGILYKHLSKFLHLNIPVEDVFNQTKRSMANDTNPQIQAEQHPDVQTNLKHPLKFHDPIYTIGQTRAFNQRLALWKQACDIPRLDPVFVEDLGVLIQFEFQSIFHNILKVYTDIKQEGVTQNCVAFMTEVPTVITCRCAVAESKFRCSQDMEDLQKLKESLRVKLLMEYDDICGQKQKRLVPIDLEYPLIAALNQFQVREPTEIEDAGEDVVA